MLRMPSSSIRLFSDPEEYAAATVTEIATEFGFWQFGRFAGEYRALFGEPLPPRSTARRCDGVRQVPASGGA